MKNVIFILAIVLYSCSFQERERIDFFKIDIDNSEIIDPIAIFDSIQLINLETNEACLIGKVKKMVVHNDTIFLFDSRQQTLFSFNMDGKFLNKIQHIGKGPGEYLKIIDFCIDKDNSQIVLAVLGGNILFYSFEGKFIEQIKLNDIICSNIEIFNNRKLLIHSDISDYKFFSYDLRKGDIIFKDIKNNNFSRKTGFGHLNPPFLQKGNGSYYFTDSFSYNIYKISLTDEVTTIELDFGKYACDFDKIPLNKGRRAYKKKYGSLIEDGKYAINILYFFETTHYYLTSFLLNKKAQTYVYDKGNRSAKLFDQYAFPTVKYYADDYLYSVFDPINIENYIPSKLSIGLKYKEVDIINDNPIVIIYKFKRNV